MRLEINGKINERPVDLDILPAIEKLSKEEYSFGVVLNKGTGEWLGAFLDEDLELPGLYLEYHDGDGKIYTTINHQISQNQVGDTMMAFFWDREFLSEHEWDEKIDISTQKMSPILAIIASIFFMLFAFISLLIAIIVDLNALWAMVMFLLLAWTMLLKSKNSKNSIGSNK